MDEIVNDVEIRVVGMSRSGNHNDWVASRGYRRRLAERLGLDFDDRAAARVATCAGGSSFDGVGRDASLMPVDERWREYVDVPEYRELLTPEVTDLAAQVFGELEAARAVCGEDALAA